jgi:hypothetical protein
MGHTTVPVIMSPRKPIRPERRYGRTFIVPTPSEAVSIIYKLFVLFFIGWQSTDNVRRGDLLFQCPVLGKGIIKMQRLGQRETMFYLFPSSFLFMYLFIFILGSSC